MVAVVAGCSLESSHDDEKDDRLVRLFKRSGCGIGTLRTLVEVDDEGVLEVVGGLVEIGLDCTEGSEAGEACGWVIVDSLLAKEALDDVIDEDGGGDGSPGLSLLVDSIESVEARVLKIHWARYRI